MVINLGIIHDEMKLIILYTKTGIVSQNSNIILHYVYGYDDYNER